MLSPPRQPAPSRLLAACLALIAIVPLGSCTGEQRPAPAAAPAPALRPAPSAPVAPPPAPPPAANWLERALTVGTWTYRADATGSSAHFGPVGAAPLLRIRCDRAGARIQFARAGAATGPMIVRTSFAVAQWPVAASTGTTPETVATRAAMDATLDQIAYSRGRFSVELSGLAPLTLPPWAEVGRVIEDCRN